MRMCSKCKIEKEENEFPKTKKKKASWCKVCNRESSRKHYFANKEMYATRRLKWYSENKEHHAKLCKERYDKKWNEIRRKANESRRNERSRLLARTLAKKYRKEGNEKVLAGDKRRVKTTPEKYAARQLVAWAIRKEIMKRPEVCEKCTMKRKIQAHHDDYTKPLQVRWICYICHAHEHGNLLDVNPKE